MGNVGNRDSKCLAEQTKVHIHIILLILLYYTKQYSQYCTNNKHLSYIIGWDNLRKVLDFLLAFLSSVLFTMWKWTLAYIILEKYDTPGQPDRGNGINALLCPPTVLSHTHTVFIYFLYVSYVISHVTGIIRFWYVTCMVLSQSAIAMVMGWWQSIDRIWMNEWVVARSEDRSCSGDQTLRHWSELCTSADSTTSLHTRHPQIICNHVP